MHKKLVAITDDSPTVARTPVPKLSLKCNHDSQLSVEAIDKDVFRVSFLPDGRRRLNATWFIANPAHNDVDQARHGSPRDSITATLYNHHGQVAFEAGPNELYCATSGAKVTIQATMAEPPALTFSLNDKPLLQDFPPSAYLHEATTDAVAGRVRHSILKRPGEFLYGFGEAAGPLERSDQRFRIEAVDAMGYTADPRRGGHSDPLYKHWPVVMGLVTDVDKPDNVDGAYAIVYDNPCRGVMDTGKEISAFRGAYRYAEFDGGDMEYWVVLGNSLADVVKRVSVLIGRPAAMPKWLLGYLGSTMAYTEADNAQERLKEFADKCKQHDIPCDAFHLSSGYSCVDADNGKDFGPRCVFTWNARRVPSPKAMFADFNDHHMHVLPNIKPWLLKDSHPRYQEVASMQAMVRLAEGDVPLEGVFWSGGAGTYAIGSYLDFASQAGFDWWVQQCKEQLLELGAGGLWNDNNEYEVDDDTALCGPTTNPIPLLAMRPIQGLLMAMASYKALITTRPQERPVIVSRSGCPGVQRYCAQTWSGDNRTGWATMAWNIPMMLNLALSGWSATSNDIGGFAGPMPEAELLVRWIQSGIAQPRFCIHSWNDDSTCTELWSHLDVLPTIRAAVRFRYSLLPYLYSLSLDNHLTGMPICRPLVLEFPTDVNVRAQDDRNDDTASTDWMLGSSLLVCPVTQPGVDSRAVYLPGTCQWYSWQTGEWHAGSTKPTLRNTISDPAPIMLMREGTGVPLLEHVTGHSVASIAQSRDGGGRVVVMAVSNATASPVTVQWYEDDGLSPVDTATRWSVTAELKRDDQDVWRASVKARCVAQGVEKMDLPYTTVTVMTPADLKLRGGEATDDGMEALGVWRAARQRRRVDMETV